MPKRPVQTHYRIIARVYDRIWADYLHQTTGVLSALAAIGSHERVLDLACGSGLFAARILDRNPEQRLLGVDLSHAMLALADRRTRHARHSAFVAADATHLPCATGTFDVVVCASALHYVDKPSAMLYEMRRVLRPGGRLVILDWCNDYQPVRLLDALLRRIDPAHARCYTAAELRRLLTATGFMKIDTARYRFGRTWGVMLARANR